MNSATILQKRQALDQKQGQRKGSPQVQSWLLSMTLMHHQGRQLTARLEQVQPDKDALKDITSKDAEGKGPAGKAARTFFKVTVKVGPHS